MLQNTEHDMPVMIFPRPIGRWQPASGAPGFLCGLWLSTWLQNNRIGSSNGVSGNEVETVPIGPIGWRTMMINRPMDSKTNPQVFRVYCLGRLYPLTPYIDLIDRYGRYLRKKSVPIIQWFVGLSGEQFPQEGAKELTTGSPQTDDEARRCFGKVRWTVEWTPVLIVKNI